MLVLKGQKSPGRQRRERTERGDRIADVSTAFKSLQ